MPFQASSWADESQVIHLLWNWEYLLALEQWWVDKAVPVGA
jgi:hypothetical protein